MHSLLLERLRDGSFFEHLPVPDHALPGETRQFEILGQFDRIHRARILAQAAEHAA